jgi:hypothetical protein
MKTLLLIIAIHALLLGFAFLIEGWASLLGVEPEEEAQIKKDYERARQNGWFEAWLSYCRYRSNFGSVQRLSAHWAERPDARKFIYVGTAFMGVAALLGIPLGTYR